MLKLSDLQLVLLSAGSQRDDGALLPLPPAITATPQRLGVAQAGLIKRGFAEKRDDAAFITAAGREAIGVEVEPLTSQLIPSTTHVPAPTSKPGTKKALLIEQLSSAEGASLAELVTATGWLPHTTRAALTGLRKGGHSVAKSKVDGVTRYRILAA